ncbi:hypothetical protein L195_g037916 [Trifolium pratense]|uniref:Uncharacterized protein n=1 Tax=Trifolium pratense TaxID=57577 RepID=A0A2K3LTM3_TRIPR|nr:hypothetical protein L195_g037916 [Trifolium pratense]
MNQSGNSANFARCAGKWRMVHRKVEVLGSLLSLAHDALAHEAQFEPTRSCHVRRCMMRGKVAHGAHILGTSTINQLLMHWEKGYAFSWKI